MSTHKIFFSYSRSDSSFALRLAKDLREAGADIWIDQLDIPAGNHWDAAVEKALESSSCILVILTPASVASANVMDETSFAIESGKKIIPVLLESCLTPFRLRRLQWVDFVTDYNAGLTNLIKSLNLTIHETSERHANSNAMHGEMLTIPSSGTRSDEKENEERENELWEEACRVNTVSSYKKYLNESIRDTYKAEARLLIKQLELEQKEDELEALLWQKAKSQHDLSLYRHYLLEYPDGNYKTLAIAAISELEKKEKPLPSPSAFKEKPAEKSNPFFGKTSGLNKNKRIVFLGLLAVFLFFGIRGFIKRTSEKRDRESWSAALLKNDSIGYALYLHKFQNGIFLDQAKNKLDSLNNSQQKRRDSLSAVSTVLTIKDTSSLISAGVKPDTTRKVASDVKKKPAVPVKPKAKFSLGQQYKGGIIIHINTTGDHGLIASNNEAVNLSWSKAQKICEVYSIGEYSDWRMPSVAELNVMFKNKKYLGTYTKGIYWSATEEGKNQAWTQNFVNGVQAKSNKASEFAVRAVRNF
jgi:TIR domain/Protein of unknown function (DUF1566)